MTEIQPISVILFDDNQNYRNILKSLLERSGILVLGSFTSDGDHFLTSEFLDMPDIAMIAFYKGVHALMSWLRELIPDMKIVLMASVYDKVSKSELAALGLDGLIYKASDDPLEMLTMLKTVKAGVKYFPI